MRFQLKKCLYATFVGIFFFVSTTSLALDTRRLAQETSGAKGNHVRGLLISLETQIENLSKLSDHEAEIVFIDQLEEQMDGFRYFIREKISQISDSNLLREFRKLQKKLAHNGNEVFLENLETLGFRDGADLREQFEFFLGEDFRARFIQRSLMAIQRAGSVVRYLKQAQNKLLDKELTFDHGEGYMILLMFCAIPLFLISVIALAGPGTQVWAVVGIPLSLMLMSPGLAILLDSLRH